MGTPARNPKYKPGRKRGRPALKLPADGLARIQAMAAEGHSERAISYALGMGRDGIQKLKNRPGGDLIQQAIDEGRHEEHASLRNALFTTATQGKGKEAVTAAIFLLKSRHGYVEARDALPTANLNIQIKMPGAMKPEQYGKLIETVAVAPPELLSSPDGIE